MRRLNYGSCQGMELRDNVLTRESNDVNRTVSVAAQFGYRQGWPTVHFLTSAAVDLMEFVRTKVWHAKKRGQNARWNGVSQKTAKERLMVLAEESGVSTESMCGDGGFYDGWAGVKQLLWYREIQLL